MAKELYSAPETLEDRASVAIPHRTQSKTLTAQQQQHCGCRLLIVPLFRGSSRFASLIFSHHSRFTCECNREKIYDDDDDDETASEALHISVE